MLCTVQHLHAAAPLLIVATCGMDKGLKGRYIPFNPYMQLYTYWLWLHVAWTRVEGRLVPFNPYTQLYTYWLWLHVAWTRVEGACYVPFKQMYSHTCKLCKLLYLNSTVEYVSIY